MQDDGDGSSRGGSGSGDDSRHLPGSCHRIGPQAAPCRLPPHLLGPAKLRYSLERWDLVAAARIALRCGDRRLEELADLPPDHAALSTPPVPVSYTHLTLPTICSV